MTRHPLPRLQAASILGRARADVVALVLMATVVALTALLASAVPPVAERTADRAVAGTVADAAGRATLVATSPGRPQDTVTVRNPQAAAGVREDAAVAALDLPPDLAAVLHPPVGSVTTSELQVLGDGPGRYLRLAYASGPRGVPAVRWIAGRAPVGSLEGAGQVPEESSPWPVQVGLSRAAASALGVEVGDRLDAVDSESRGVDVRVSGIFVAEDTDDEAWQADPRLLHPSGASPLRISASALVSDESLPDLALAVPADDLTRRVLFTPRPAQFRWRQTDSLAREAASLKAKPSRNADGGTARSWETQLDSVLRRAHDEAATARAQAAVLVLGLLAGAALVLALTAQLLVRRRSAALVVARERGAGLGTIAAELLVESVTLTTVATAVGIAATWLLVGSVSWTWPLPVAAVGVLAVPVLGLWVSANAASGRRVPANRGARRRLLRARRLRRVVAETAVVAATLAALVALDQRGVISTGSDDSVDLLAVSAPTLVIVLGALAVLRLVPWAARVTLSRLRRSVRAVPFLSAASAGADAARPLPFLVIALAVGQLTFGAALAASLAQGQSAEAWRSVGADARLEAEQSPGLVPLARRVLDAPGVDGAVAARVADGVLASSGTSAAVVRLVVVDSDAYARLLSHTPYAAPQLRRLHRGDTVAVPALVGGGLSGRRTLTISWQDTEVPLRVVGSAPKITNGSTPVVVVDAAAFTATGPPAPPGTIWATGPGAAAALDAVRGEAGSVAPVVDRRDVLAHQRAAPLGRGLRELVLVAGGLLSLLVVLGVLLGAALGATTRLASLSRLRTLGLFRAEARLVLAGHLLPPVLLAAVTGAVLGAACAIGLLPMLDLGLLIGPTKVTPVAVPWWTAALIALLAILPAALVVGAESSRRRPPLSDLQRAGSG